LQLVYVVVLVASVSGFANGQNKRAMQNGMQSTRGVRGGYPNDYPNGGRNSGSNGPSASDWFDAIVPNIPKILPPPQGGGGRNRQYYEDDEPQYYQQQPQYVPAPAPTPTPRKAPKNVVTKKKPAATRKPKVNKLDKPVTNASRETDARQEKEVSDVKSMFDQSLTAEMPPGLQGEWAEIVRKGNQTKDVDKFIKDHGPAPAGDGALSAGMLKDFETRQKFAVYGDNLEAGNLTDAQQVAALDDLQTSVNDHLASGGSTTFFGTVDGKLTNMRDFNTMGQLAAATQNSDNPFPTLLQGAGQMGMPVMFVSEMTGYPVMSVSPVASGGAAPGGALASILLVNPASNDEAVSYLLDDHSYEMSAGQQQPLDRSYMVSFDPGSGGAQKEYRLTDGVYEWRNDSATGWNLYKVKVTVTIDNSRYDGEFHYLLNNEDKSVAAGDVVEHASESPIEVAFDGGKGGSETRKLLKTGRYVVGLDPTRGALDLFDSTKVDEADAKEPEYVSSTVIGGSNATQAERVEALIAQTRGGGRRSQDRAGAGGKVVSPIGAVKASTKSPDELLKLIKPKEAAGGN